jgi:hypothetical protein
VRRAQPTAAARTSKGGTASLACGSDAALQPFPHPTPLYVLSTIFYYLSSKDFSSYNSFSQTIPPVSIPSIYYHSLTNYFFNVFEF